MCRSRRHSPCASRSLADNEAFFTETPAGSGRATGITGRGGQDRSWASTRLGGRRAEGRRCRRSVSEIIQIGESAGRRREVLRVLRASADPMSIIAIADELGVHPNTVRFHLDSLLGEGQVEQVEPGRKGPGRPPLMFRAVRQMDRGGTRHYRLLAEILSAAFAAERNSRAKALAAGRAWGRRMASATAAGDARAPKDHRPPGRCARRARVRPRAPGDRRGTADRPAALPVPGTRRKPDQRRVPGAPRADAGGDGNLGGAGHRRSAGGVRRTGSVRGAPDAGSGGSR